MADLWVWMNGERVGTWFFNRGLHRFAYTREWAESAHARPISLSLPITAELELQGEHVENYFDNLLPDSKLIREQIAARFAVRDLSPFSLLEAVGRDCIGAVQLLPPEIPPDGYDQIRGELLDTPAIAQALRDVPVAGVGAQTDVEVFRLSLAGAQDKTALALIGGRWHRPIGATPSTHIFKLPIVNRHRTVQLFDTVANEWVCAQILTALGLPTARAEMAQFEDQEALIVERFDRQWVDGGRWIARLPQEDLCQALGVPPGRKYEAHGGPGASACLDLLAGSDAPADPLAFQLAMFAYWLMAAIDGHAKNFSIFLYPGGRFAMTPLYDVMSVWPYVGNGIGQWRMNKLHMAMAVRGKNRHYALDRIRPRYWRNLTGSHGGEEVWQQMILLAERVPEALDTVETILAPDFPERIWIPIAREMRAQAQHFLDGVEAA
ncbi:Serine/threonine-protein kinase HipA [Pigmentiphaga humi]|uniref:Serine/threonine-protein kinase HipA n=1 Tax=Pigmentiphaga humi TaxID=2478468 RepID=A0A3P4B673_9BURK|nr:type II toxin-antitoxin system HipA family toxin [Pigmentiphaga humi]VCU71813.1 Serine/threonine-protein kinase HipA [Pigmentiphaga humi]